MDPPGPGIGTVTESADNILSMRVFSHKNRASPRINLARQRQSVEIPRGNSKFHEAHGDSVATDLEEPSGSDLMAQLVVNQGRRCGFVPTRSGLSSGVCPHLINLTPDRDSTSLAYAMSTPCLAE